MWVDLYRFYVLLMSTKELSYVIFEEAFLTETEKNTILGKSELNKRESI